MQFRRLAMLPVVLLAVSSLPALAQSPAPAGKPGYKVVRPTYSDWKEARANETMDAEAKMAKAKKMAAVNKVTQLMVDLQAKVMREGEQEAQSYDKFACFCKTGQAEKAEAIQEGQDEKAELSASITELSEERDKLDTKIAELEAEIEKTRGEMKKLTAANAAAVAAYEKDDEDLRGAIFGLEEAIKVLKAARAPDAAKPEGTAEIQVVQKAVETASVLGDALGIDSTAAQQKVTAFLQQNPDVPMKDYDFHSEGVIKTLEKLLHDFRATKEEEDKQEVERKHTYDQEMQARTDAIKAMTKEMEDAKKERDERAEQIAKDSERLTTVSAVLLDDQEYLATLTKMCSEKAKTWDQRSKVRQAELHTLTTVIGILKGSVAEQTSAATVRLLQGSSKVHFEDSVANNEQALEALEADAEAQESGAAPTFLQLRGSRPGGSLLSVAAKSHEQGDGARQAVITLLSSKGAQLRSSLLTSLATRLSEDPFAKIKILIQELIERLLKEAANEANQKGWCDKSMADAKQKRDYAAQEVEQLNAKMAELEATRDKLAEELAILTKEIKELEAEAAEAAALRAQDHAENMATIEEADQGLQAITMAMTIFDRFYKTVADGSLELAQQSPFEDAPDTGFAINETYTGAQGEATGILGMMEVIQSDFKRTISETKKAEKQAQDEYLEYTTEVGKSLAEKNVASEQTKKLLREAKEKLETANDELDAQTGILGTAIQELLELKPACIDTGMSYQDRVANREEEIAALKKALCILGAYQQYGPDGLSDAC